METDPDIWNVMTVNANASGMTRFVQFESTYNALSVVTVTDTGLKLQGTAHDVDLMKP